MTAPSIRAEAAAAVRAVNAHFHALPESAQKSIAIEYAELDAALACGDLAAVDVWRDRWLGILEEVAAWCASPR